MGLSDFLERRILRVEADTRCELCQPLPPGADRGRYVWEDDRWRLWTLTTGQVPGYSFLTPKRHIPYVTDLDGAEATALGPVLARLSAAVRDAAGAELVHLHVFGDGVAHFHVHLVPHTRGDSLSTTIVREDAGPEPSVEKLAEVAARLADTLSTARGSSKDQ